MNALFATTFGAVVLSVAAVATQSTPPVNQTDAKTFRGCLQGDTSKGFALLAATGDGSGGDQKGQTMTYRVVPAARIDLTRHVNKVVEISGALSTAPAKTGSMPAPVPDTVRGTGGAGGTGKPGEDTATYYANGTLTAKSIRELAPTCAVRSAPDNDKKPQ
jgi:hypothetical protein